MQGLMMETPLLISSLIEHAGRFHADTEIVTRTVEGPIHRHTYRDAHGRARKLAKALASLGVGMGDRVATLAWNTHRHFEIYYAVSGMGAVCHTINPRLFPPQIVYIVNHAEDSFVFVDLTFVAAVGGGRRPTGIAQGHRGDDRPGTHAGDQAPKRDVLRNADLG